MRVHELSQSLHTSNSPALSYTHFAEALTLEDFADTVQKDNHKPGKDGKFAPVNMGLSVKYLDKSRKNWLNLDTLLPAKDKAISPLVWAEGWFDKDKESFAYKAAMKKQELKAAKVKVKAAPKAKTGKKATKAKHVKVQDKPITPTGAYGALSLGKPKASSSADTHKKRSCLGKGSGTKAYETNRTRTA